MFIAAQLIFREMTGKNLEGINYIGGQGEVPKPKS